MKKDIILAIVKNGTCQKSLIINEYLHQTGLWYNAGLYDVNLGLAQLKREKRIRFNKWTGWRAVEK